jgi:glycerophosphoryl diester phosphodiesterase
MPMSSRLSRLRTSSTSAGGRRAGALVAVAAALVATGIGGASADAGTAGVGTKAGGGGVHFGKGFDLEGHRGTRGLRPEDTLPAFSEALTLGVRTLELDTGITKDGVVIISHEQFISPLVCTDTGPVRKGDKNYPYVGKYYHQLTFAEVETVDCGTRHPVDPTTDPFYNSELPVPGTRIPTLDQVFDLVEQRHADDVQLNIETKIDPTQPQNSVGPEQFVKADLAVIRRHRDGIARSLLQSFDWRTLKVSGRLAPDLRRVALIEADTADIGQPGASPWLAGIDIDAAPYNGDPASAAATVDAAVISPDYTFFTDPMIASAHQHGQLVVPFTVDADPVMIDLIHRGVDGFITDYPNQGRDVLASLGIPLPRRYPTT